MAAALVISEKKGGSVNGVTTDGVNTTGANFGVCVVDSFLDGVAVTDNKNAGNWTGLTVRGANIKTKIFYRTNPSSVGAGHTVTAALNGSYPRISVYWFSGMNTTSPFDAENGANSSTSTSKGTGSVTPSEAGEVIIAGVGFTAITSNLSIGDGFIGQLFDAYSSGNYMGGAGAYLIHTTGAISPTWMWTSSVENSAVIACFKAAAAGGTILNPMTGPLAPRGFLL